MCAVCAQFLPPSRRRIEQQYFESEKQISVFCRSQPDGRGRPLDLQT